jgi:anti-sigma regulatory factor (Ser/Thr protein kinase)/putative methionine-R-sulfoxide reductase with GAF domain
VGTPNAQPSIPAPGRGQVFLGIGDQPAFDGSPGQLEQVYRLADPALSELPLEPLLDELLARAREILGVDTVAILLLDEETQELVARAAKGIEEEVERGVRIPVGGGFAGRIAAGRTPIYIADVDHAEILNPILRMKGIRSLLGVPMMVAGTVIGVLHVGTVTPREFTNQDAALLQLAAARAAPAIDRARLFDALDREHRIAVALQRSLLPDRLPDLVGIETAARYLPSRDEVGGDWYDVIDLPGGSIGLAIGDVAGHGLRAAALMGQLRTGLRAYALDGHPPADALKRLDRLLQTISGRGMATAGYAIVDPATGALRYASAGHPPPVLIRQGARAELLDARTAPPLGSLPFAAYNEVQETLRPGDTILLYTDGLVERRREALTTGLERLRALAAAPLSAEALCQRVVEQLVPAAGGDDDIAVVALRLAPLEADLNVRFAADPQVLSQMRRTIARWLQAHGAQAPEVAAITLACGEACANAIEHAYAPGVAYFELGAAHDGGVVTITVRDTGRWRAARGTNRGRGLKMMAAAVDELDVRTTNSGTEVVMRQRLGSR